MSLLVSILIPAYNAESFLDRTIKSALSQTWYRKEVIIVDDGSTDQTLTICRRYECRSVKVIQQDNQGGCAARNRAFRECQGDYIQWLDADDLLGIDKVERQAKLAEEVADPNVLYTCSWGSFYFRKHKAKFRPSALWQDHSAEEWLLTWLVDRMMPVSTWLISRQVTEQAGPWDVRLKRNQDGEYFCRVVALSKSVKFVQDAVFYYRRGNPSSLTKQKSFEMYDSLCLSLELIVRHVLSRVNNDRARHACIKRLNSTISLLDSVDVQLGDRIRSQVKQLGGEIVPTKVSRKQEVVEKIVGKKITRGLKAVEWRTRWRIKSKLDFFLARLFGSSSEDEIWKH
jgi:glycosyltransferase involved in cell wall biosynthesis